MVKIYSVWSSSLLFCKISLCSYHWSTFWIYKTRTPNTRIIIFNVGMFWIILQWMQIGKIEVEFVMLIIEEAFAWLRWIINNCRIIRNSWIFQPIEHVFDKTSIFQFKKIKNGCIHGIVSQNLQYTFYKSW